MLIKQVSLKNFRNYIDETVQFPSGLSVLSGANGQGKTNILEGIYYLLTGKSYRAQREHELVRWEQNSFSLRGDFLSAGKNKLLLESHYENKKKVIKINHIPCRKLSDFVGTVNAIFFSPDDLAMVKGGPGERRRFLDFHIVQMRPVYAAVLNSYGKVLKQKSALLNSPGDEQLKYIQLQLWNEQMIVSGEKIMRGRAELINRLQSMTNQIYGNLTARKEKITLIYQALGKADVSEAIAGFPRLLESKMEQEIRRRMILAGPHHDDLQILMDGRSARHFASQGQQRSIVLSLKLAELELIRREKGEYPLLLLDDVLSELDNFRKEYLIQFIETSEIQTLLTMTGAKEKLAAGTGYIVEQGRIRRK